MRPTAGAVRSHCQQSKSESGASAPPLWLTPTQFWALANVAILVSAAQVAACLPAQIHLTIAVHADDTEMRKYGRTTSAGGTTTVATPPPHSAAAALAEAAARGHPPAHPPGPTSSSPDAPDNIVTQVPSQHGAHAAERPYQVC